MPANNIRGSEAGAPLLIGAHVSIAGGVHKAIERGVAHECTAIQIFVKGNTRWDFPPLDAKEAELFRQARRDSPIKVVIAHSIYLVNMATSDPVLREKTIADLVDELERCEVLGLDALVVHPGAHGGDGVEVGIERVATALDEIVGAVGRGRCRILLETTAGQGTSLGADFRELREMLRRARCRSRLGVCLDTAHVFAVGYDIRTAEGYRRLWHDFDTILGRELLVALHLNDSKVACATRVDRHQHIGRGMIGEAAFRRLLRDHTLRGLPMVTETPSSPNLEEIRWLFAAARGRRIPPPQRET
ncbi:MAG: deoxyribonuclease IV [Candidatus Sumerlaeaceae bacterium]|jgi:deoxyribonuclease-4